MSLQLEKLEKNMAKLTIEVPVEELEKGIERAYHQNKSKISVPGFRKGKVPRAVIEKMYGKGVFLEDAANDLLPSAYENALEECEEEVVSSPKIEVVQLIPDKPFIFTAEVALKPPVELGKYKGVEVEKADLSVTDEEVSAEIDKERDKNSRTISVEDRPVQDGDMTIINFEGFVDGVAFEGGKGENYPLTIGSGAFIPGFEEQLVGTELNQEVEVNVTFPDDYHVEELAGKPAVFKCTVLEIKEKELPELDDEFAAEVSEFDTLDEYKEDVRKNLTEKKEQEAKDKKESDVIEAIINDSNMDIPEPMIETKQRQLVDEFAQRIRMQGMTMEQYFQFTGLTRDQLLVQVRPQAEASIKSRLVLEEIVKAENIEATEEDFEKELQRMADIYQIDVSEVKDRLGEQGSEDLRKDLAVSKAAEFVVSNAVEK